MSLPDLHDPVPTVATAALAAAAGVFFGSYLVARGLRQLDVLVTRRRVRLWSSVASGVAGVAAILATRHAGSWWLLPAALAWTYSLAAAAVCDAFTQRVPTAVVRQGAVATGVLVLAAAIGDAYWRWAVLAAVSAVSAGLIFAFCWRFLGAGYGDVRIAVLGGLGLTRPTYLGIAAAVGVFIVITLSQAITVLARGGNRHTMFPYGPAIAAAFAIAAVA